MATSTPGERFDFSRYSLSPEAREEIVRGIFDYGIGQTIKIMVVGETGQGKSSLINALLGEEVAGVGHSVEASGTTRIQEYRHSKNGVNVVIWDCPGFGANDIADDEIVDRLRLNDLQDIDFTFFCIRMDQTRIPTRFETETIVQLTKIFGEAYWKKCLFVLTFANMVEGMDREDEEISSKEFFWKRLKDIQQSLQKTLETSAGVNFADGYTVSVAPVGSGKRKQQDRPNPWALPDREDWCVDLWMEVACCINPIILPGLLQVNCHRLNDPPSCVESSQPAIFVPRDQHIQDGPSVINQPILPPVVSLPPSYEQPIVAQGGSLPQAINPQRSVNKDSKTPQRNIPWHEMLLIDLQKKDSFLHTYIFEFAKGKYKHEQPGGLELIVKGAYEGLKAWLASKISNLKSLKFIRTLFEEKPYIMHAQELYYV